MDTGFRQPQAHNRRNWLQITEKASSGMGLRVGVGFTSCAPPGAYFMVQDPSETSLSPQASAAPGPSPQTLFLGVFSPTTLSSALTWLYLQVSWVFIAL